MKILLLNDTALVPHAGCQAVSDAHARMLGRRGHEITKRHFLNALPEIASMAEAEAISAILHDESLASDLQSVDAVVLNGEGTIHHGAGRQWLAMLGAAQRCGKATILANAVFEETFAFESVLRRLDDFVVRDERSAAFARSRGLRCRVALDSALEANFADSAFDLGAGNVVVTDWHDQRNPDVGAACLSLLGDPGLQSDFLPFHAIETQSLWRHYPATMARYAVVVTGRHHGVYFAIRAGRPFVPLGSNTQKVEGFLEFVQAPFAVATTKDSIIERLAWAEKNTRAFEEIFDKVRGQMPLDTFAVLGGDSDPSGAEREIARLAREVALREDAKAVARWSVAASNRRFKLAVTVHQDMALPNKNAAPSERSVEAGCADLLANTRDEPVPLLIASGICLKLGSPRQAYVAIDRLINIDPNNEDAWARLLQILPEADEELTYWIGLKASWSRRVDVMTAAACRLIGNRAQWNRVLEFPPGADWPAAIADAFWDKLGSDVDPMRIADLASFFESNGHTADAERLLRAGANRVPPSLEANLALVSFLEAQSRFDEIQEIARKMAGLWPTDPRPRLLLARIQRHLWHHKQAAETLQKLLAVNAENPAAWLELGQLSQISLELPADVTADSYEHLSKLAGNDPRLLEKLAVYHFSERNFAKAAGAFDRLFACDPHAIDNPATCRNYANALNQVGRPQDAAKAIAHGIETCRKLAQTASEEDWEICKRTEALLLAEGGRESDANQTLISIRAARSTTAWKFDRPEYLPETQLRLKRLRDIVAGRDVIAFAHGPSFSDFAVHMEAIADIDFATATLGSFPPVDEELMRRIGRRLDVLLLTPPNRVRAWFTQLQAFLDRPSPNMLITSRHAMSVLVELGQSESDFVERHDRRLMYIHPDGGPPLPSRPMHFEHGNSLALLLPLLVLSRPRRIFLVGADGGAPHPANQPYFFYRDAGAGGGEPGSQRLPDLAVFDRRPDRVDEANRRWRREAAESDGTILLALRHLAVLFDVPTPPIFNVCPHSAHAAFAKLGYEEAVAMIRDQPTIASLDSDRVIEHGASGGWATGAARDEIQR